jgi:hypothetical protein
MKKFSIALLAVAAAFAIVPAASADSYNVDLNFASGATFTGIVTFAPGDTSIVGVDGTLNGYNFGSYSYTVGGSDLIDWVWDSNNYASSPSDYGNFLMDGSGSDENGNYTNFVEFTYNYSGAPTLSLAPGDTGANPYYPFGVSVDYDDPLVSGSISATPEPGTLVLLGTGLLGLAFVAFRKGKASNRLVLHS